MSFWMPFCGICLICFLPLVAFQVIAEIGELLSALLTLVIIGGLLYTLVAFINMRRTKYFLTSDRILETRGGIIRKELPLERFHGKPLTQFLEVRVTHTENNRPIYGIRIYDPITADTLDIKGQDATSARAFERISEAKECPYCGYDNPAARAECKNCDAVL